MVAGGLKEEAGVLGLREEDRISWSAGKVGGQGPYIKEEDLDP